LYFAFCRTPQCLRRKSKSSIDDGAQVLIVTNLQRFPLAWTSTSGYSGKSIIANSTNQFLQHRHQVGTVFLVNCDPELSFQLAAALWFRKEPSLVTVDLVLRRSYSIKSNIALYGRRVLLRRFSHHIHYFRDLSAYRQIYGITPEHSSFVPFKASLQFDEDLPPDGNGKYVLCFGQSMRDFDTFLCAMEILQYPAAIPEPDFALLRKHGSKFTRPLNKLPANVQVLPDDKSAEDQKRMLRDARLVVLPILKSSMVASGISTSLNSMLAGKCVIGTKGPGTSDIFNTELLLAPPENPEALAEVVRRAWEDAALRQRTAAYGQRLAKSLGGEPELYQRIIDAVALWSHSKRDSDAAGAY
jgi:glycosyltransferase involved in cell wall biosynthesis